MLLPPDHSSETRPTSRAGFFLAHAQRAAAAHELLSTGSFESELQLPRANADDFVDNLIKKNQQVWDAYIGHKFPKDLANGTASLDGFRNYMIQDKLYLELYLRANMRGAAAAKSFDEVEAYVKKAPSTAQYVRDANDTIVSKLGVSQEVINNTKPSTELLASTKFYTEQTSDNNPDAWFDIHVALVPCIVGYAAIAGALLKAPSTIRNTPYYPLWIKYNSGGSSAANLRDFLDKNKPKNPDQKTIDKWNKIFKEACGHESNFLGLGLTYPDTYNIASDGEFEIRHFASGGSLGVNTGQTGVIIVLKPTTPQLWKLSATKDKKGYTIQVAPNGKYLKAEGNNTSLSDQAAYWWINPALSAPDKTCFQVMVVNKLQSCLSSESTQSVVNPVACDSNNGVGSQMWSFIPKK